MLFFDSYIDYNSVLFYIHIPKSGGTSVRQNLAQFFNDDQVIRLIEPSINHYIGNKINSSYESENEKKINIWLKKKIPLIKKIIKFKNFSKNFFKKNDDSIFRNFDSLTTEEKQKLRLISSNQERMCAPNILGKHILKITTIRDPISRVQSYYFEAKRDDKAKKPYQIAASKYDINSFIKYLYDNEPLMVNNPYCVCLSGTKNFLITKKIIDNEFFLAAPVEKLDEFLHLLSTKIFSIKKEFKKFRVSNNNPKKNIISDELTDRILSTNKADSCLKKYIETEFENILNNYKDYL